MSRLILLLPPSEGKAPGGQKKRSPDHFARQLGAERVAVRAAVARLLQDGTRELWSTRFKVRGDLLDRAVDAMRVVAADSAATLPAWQRYTGVVWDFLEPTTLTPEQRRAILVPSALYGLTTADDVIADYRLTMNVSLPGVGNLGRFWTGRLTEEVGRLARRAHVVDLLPNEHAGAIDFARTRGVLHVAFLGASGGGAAGHVAKSVKGRFARHLVDHGIDQALEFRFDGWSISENAAGLALVKDR